MSPFRLNRRSASSRAGWSAVPALTRLEDRIALASPASLLIYYSYPSVINGATTTTQAATEFGRYDQVVLGGGLEQTTHPDHANTVAIIHDANDANTTFLGYVDLGVYTSHFTTAQIDQRID